MKTNEELKEEYGLTVQQVNALDEARADEREQLSDSPTHDDWVRKQERQKCIRFLNTEMSEIIWFAWEDGDLVDKAIAKLEEGLK